MANASLRNPVEHILQFFAYEHLPPSLQAVSKPFCELANLLASQDRAPGIDGAYFPIPRNPERTVALRKLLESKDAAVRAVIAKETV